MPVKPSSKLTVVGADKLWAQIGDLVAGGQQQPFIRLQFALLVWGMTAFGLTLVALSTAARIAAASAPRVYGFSTRIKPSFTICGASSCGK